MRYLFVAASWLRPALRAELAFSQLRRVIAAVQGIALFAALFPELPAAAAVTAAALALLCFSFGRNVIPFERAGRESGRAAGVNYGEPRRGEN